LVSRLGCSPRPGDQTRTQEYPQDENHEIGNVDRHSACPEAGPHSGKPKRKGQPKVETPRPGGKGLVSSCSPEECAGPREKQDSFKRNDAIHIKVESKSRCEVSNHRCGNYGERASILL